MRITVAVLADYANVTREGKLNILGIFDQIRAPRLPVHQNAMQIVLRLEVEPAELDREHEIEIRCMDADGQGLFKIEGKFMIARGSAGPGGPARVNHVIGLNNLVFHKWGTHTVSVFINRDLKTQIGLEVVRAEPEPPRLPGS